MVGMRITDALRAEHTIYLHVFEQIERALPSMTTSAEVRTMAQVIEGLLHGHALRETNLAYVALDHVLEERGQLDRMHEDHREIDARLKSVTTAGTVADARRLFEAALHSSREHFNLEEKVLFPLLERVLQTETLTSLGRSWLDRHEFAAAR